MTPEQIQHLTSIYQNHPDYFNEDEVNTLAAHNAAIQARAQQQPDGDFDLLRTAEQFTDGVIKGATGIFDPELGGKARNTTEEIAKSVGELGGFLGLMFVPFGAVAKGLGWGARAMKLATTAEYLGKAERMLQGASALKSVPVAIGEKAIEAFGAERAGALAAKVGGVFGGSEAAVGIAKQAIAGGIRMGTASAISSYTFGDGRNAGEVLHDALSAGSYGIIFGGAMDVAPGMVGSLPYLKESATMRTMVQAITGAVVNAAPTMAGGADASKVIYEGAVGAFFGAKALSWKNFRAQENLAGGGYAWGTFPETNMEAQKAFRGREAELKEMGEFRRQMDKEDSKRNILIGLSMNYLRNTLGEETMSKVFDMKALNRYINNGFMKHAVGDYVMEELSGDSRMRVTDILRDEHGNIDALRGVDPNGKIVTIPADRAIRDAEPWDIEDAPIGTPQKEIIANPAAKEYEKLSPAQQAQMIPPEKTIVADKPETVNVGDTPIEQNGVDFETENTQPNGGDKDEVEGYYQQLGGVHGAVKHVAAKIFGFDPKLRTMESEGHAGNFLDALLQTAKAKRENVEGNRGIHDLLDYIHGQEKFGFANAKNITIDDLHDIMPLWNQATQSINIPHMYYDGGKLVPFTELKDSNMTLNGKGDAVDNRSSRMVWHLLNGDDAVRVISGYSRHVDGELQHSELNEANLDAKDFKRMQAQLHSQGYYLFSAGADKPIFLAVKYIDGGMSAEDVAFHFNNYRREIEALPDGKGADFSKHLLELQQASQLDMPDYQRIVLNNIMYYERMNGMKFVDAMKAGKVENLKDQRMIVDVVNFNKRIQPLMTNMYSVDRQVLEHFNGGQPLNMRGVIVHDSSLKENTDGGTIVRRKVMELFHKAAGIPLSENHTKSFIYGTDGAGKGMYIFKHGEQSSTVAMEQAMEKAGITHIARPTGVKQMGMRKVYRMEFDEQNADLTFIDNVTGEVVANKEKGYAALDTIELKPEDMHISSSIHDDIEHHLNGFITFPKQAIYHGSNYEAGGVAVAEQMKWILEKFHGNADANAKLDEYLANEKARDPKQLAWLVKNIDHIGVKKVLAAMSQNETLRERFTQKILQALDDVSMVDGEGFATEIPDGLMAVKRMIAMGAKTPILYSKPGRKVTEQAITRFVVNRLTHPKVKSSGKATMHTFGEDLAQSIGGADKLTKKNFYLDDYYKDLKVKGVVYKMENNKPTENIKRGMVRLEDQFNSFKRVEEKYNAEMEKPEAERKASVIELYNEMNDALHFAVTRVPMDSFSGMVKLKFEGFTGMKGGSILLHGETKQQLGGADNDGDTAFFFHGLPKEFMTALENNRDNFEKYSTHTDTRSTKFKTDEKRIFFTEGSGIYVNHKNTIAGMLDPFARATVGHAVSKGRGSMLPQAVRYVDIMKKVLDTAYMKGGRLELRDDKGNVIHLEARDYDAASKIGDGKTLGAYGQLAINSSADAGKEAGMVTQDQMKAILTASAFKKITVNGETIFDADGMADFNRANHADVLKRVADLVGEDGLRLEKSGTVKLMGTEVGKYSKFLTTMFGYNTKMRQPYTLQEVQAAAADVPDYFETPYRAIMEPMKDVHYNDGLIERILMPYRDVQTEDGTTMRQYPQRKAFEGFLNTVREFMRKPENRMYVDNILPKGVFVEIQNLMKHASLFGRYYDSSAMASSDYNFATVSGMRKFAENDVLFDRYLRERIGIYEGKIGKNGQPMKDWQIAQELMKEYGDFYRYNQATIDADKEAIRSTLGRVATPEELWDIRLKARKADDGINVENRVKFLQGERIQVSDYLASRIEDIASSAFIAKLVKRAGLTEKDAEFIKTNLEEFVDDKGVRHKELTADTARKYLDPTSTMKPTLIDLVKLVKFSQDFFRKKDSNIDADVAKDKFGKDLKMSAQEAAKYAIGFEAHLRRIADSINQARIMRDGANAEQVSYRALGDVYHGLLVSTVLKGGENQATGVSKFGLDVVPNRILNEYARTIGQVFNESQKTAGDYDVKKVFGLIDAATPKSPIEMEKSPAPTSGSAAQSETTPNAETTTKPQATATEKEAQTTATVNKAIESGRKILQHFNLRVDGANPQEIEKNLTKREREAVEVLSKFMIERKHIFGNDMRKFFQMANGMISNSPGNPNQWSIHDVEGLVNQIRKMQNSGTMLDMITGIFKGNGAGWALFAHMPGNVWRRMFENPADFYLKENAVYDKDGDYNANAGARTYQDDTGKMHTGIFMDEAVPMNTALRNWKAHENMDYVVGEAEKKVHDVLARFFSWMNGGIVDDENLVKNYTDTIQKIAVYRREYEAAQRSGEQDRIDKSYARLRGENDELYNAWQEIKDRQVRLTDDGRPVAMSGEEAIQKTMGSLEALSKEYQKYIVLTDEALQKYFVTRQVIVGDNLGENVVRELDHRATADIFQSQLNSKEGVAPYDAINLFNYLRQIDLNVRKMSADYKRFTLEDVENLNAFDKGAEVKAAHPTIKNQTTAKLFLKYYNHLTGRYPSEIDEAAVLASPFKDMWLDAKRVAAMDVAQNMKTDHAYMMGSLGAYMGGHGELDPKDFRSRLFGWNNYNQLEHDRLFAKGRTDTNTYLTNRLYNYYRFQETELIDGWFPHRDFDKTVVQKHLERMEKEILQRDAISTEDRKHYENLQYIYKRLMDEDANPGSIDDGKLYDVSLSKDGILPLAHVVGSAPAALKERTADIEGYSVRPVSMTHAITSVISSGQAKLVATLNNDAILKFRSNQFKTTPPPSLVGAAREAWITERDTNVRRWEVYMRQFERQAFNRPSIYTNEVLSDPTVKLKWTPAYWFSDQVMLSKPFTMVHRWYRELTKIDHVTDIDKALFLKETGRAMTDAEAEGIKQQRRDDALDFSMERKADGTMEYTAKAWKNMERAARMMKGFSQLEAKFEMASLLFHTKFAINNIYGGVANDYIYNGFAPMRQARDIKYWNAINSNWKTMDDVHRFFDDSGVLEKIILRDTGFTGKKEQPSLGEKVADKAAFFMKKTEPWLRRQAAMHGYIAARESMTMMGNLEYDNPYLLNMARKSVEASQFLYNNYNRPAFMATNMGKMFTRFKLWGMNSLKMQGDIMDAAAGVGFKKGSMEMERYQRMYWANMFMFGLALMFPHTIFQNQLPQPVDTIASLSGVMFGDDDKNAKKRKALFEKNEDPIRGYIAGVTQVPFVSFPGARAPLGIYDLPATFRAIWSHDVHDMATATTLNLLPFGRMTKDVLQAYEQPSMAAELIAGIPLHRVDNFFTKAKRKRMLSNIIEDLQTGNGPDDQEVEQMMRMR